MNKIFMIAKKKLALYVVILMCAPSFAIAEDLQKESEVETATFEKSDHLPEKIDQFSVETFATTEQDLALLKILDETKTFKRIQKIINTNFNLSNPIRLHIQQPKESQFLATELDQKSHIIFLSFNFLHTLYQGLSNKYEHQKNVIQDVFSTGLEFFVWSEFAAFFIQAKQLEIQGDAFTTRDNFASIMLLNQNNTTSEYTADAAEAYLLIDSNSASNFNLNTKNELQLDQQRYRHIICMNIGYDEWLHKTDIEKDHLDSFSWDEEKIAACKVVYAAALENWYEALKPVLSDKNLIKNWLKETDTN